MAAAFRQFFPSHCLYIYGYLNRVQSSRRLEREALRNVELMWLTGRLAPDHKTIADFRKDNGAAIQSMHAVHCAVPHDGPAHASQCRHCLEYIFMLPSGDL